MSGDGLGAWVAELDGEVVGHVALHRSSLPVVMGRAREALRAASGDELAVVARLIVDPGMACILADPTARSTAAMSASRRWIGAAEPVSTQDKQ